MIRNAAQYRCIMPADLSQVPMDRLYVLQRIHNKMDEWYKYAQIKESHLEPCVINDTRRKLK